MPCRAGGALRGAGVPVIMVRRAPFPRRGLAVGAELLPGPFEAWRLLSEAGREQARLTGQRLRQVPLAAICHGPLPRAAQTAAIIAEAFPGVPVSASDLAGDYIPADPGLADLPARFAS